MLESFFNEAAGLRPTLIKNRLRHKRFPVNFPKFLRTPILQNIYKRLLLSKLETTRNLRIHYKYGGNTERACFRWLLLAYQPDFR